MSRFDPKNSYTPSTTLPKAWADIETFYVSLTEDAFDQQPMVDLIRHIRTAYAEGRLHAITSMHTLVVSVKPAEFTRRYATPLGIEKFDGFVGMIGW